MEKCDVKSGSRRFSKASSTQQNLKAALMNVTGRKSAATVRRNTSDASVH